MLVFTATSASAVLRSGLRNALALTTLTLASALGCGGGVEAHPQVAPAQPQPAIAIRVAIAEAIPDVSIVRELGELQPWRRLTIRSEVSGWVRKVNVDVGDQALANDQLAVEIDRRWYEAMHDRAQAELTSAIARRDLATTELARVAALFTKGRATTSQHDTAQATLREAVASAAAYEANLKRARMELEGTNLWLPEGWHVQARVVEPRAFVQPGTPLLEVVDNRRLLVHIEVAGNSVVAAKIGKRFRCEAKGGAVGFEAIVIRIAPAANIRSRRFPLELEVVDPPPSARPGLLTIVHIPIERSLEKLIVVPRAAVSSNLGWLEVAVITETGLVDRRQVERRAAPALPPGLVAVTGVDVGTRIAIERVATLRQDALVVVRD